MQRADPSAPGFKRPANADQLRAEYSRGSGRCPNKKIPRYFTISDLGIDVTGKTVDLASLPLVHGPAGPRLDMQRVAAELLRPGEEAGVALSTIALSDSALCVMYDLAANEAGVEQLSGGDIGVVAANLHHLVGHIMPVFGQVRRPGNGSRIGKTERSMAAIQPGGAGGQLPPAHHFALQPVQLSSIGGRACNQGAILAQGVVVSNRCYNFPLGDEQRVGTGRNPAFEESICYVLITHAYLSSSGGVGGLAYTALGPPSVRAVPSTGEVRILDDDSRNQHESLFGWRSYMVRSIAETGQHGVSSFGLSDIKQTGKDTKRRMVPWSIQRVATQLQQLRAEGDATLADYLRDVPMRAALEDVVNPDRPIGGIDLRRMLLVEMLLKDTPMEMLLQLPAEDRDPAALVAALPVGPLVPGGAKGLYERMKTFCDAHYTYPTD